jgi:hypothetical protein
MPSGAVNVQRSASILSQIQATAIRLAGTEKMSDMHKRISQKNSISAQDIGNLGRKTTVEYHMNRGPQDRFIDIFT